MRTIKIMKRNVVCCLLFNEINELSQKKFEVFTLVSKYLQLESYEWLIVEFLIITY